MSGSETLLQSHYCHEHTAAETYSIPFSLEKTLEVLQCTSHQDLLKRGERGQVNGMVWQTITQAWQHLQVVAQVLNFIFLLFKLLFSCNPLWHVLFHSCFIANKVSACGNHGCSINCLHYAVIWKFWFAYLYMQHSVIH